ncbi:hypothetical protein [Marinomonas fungiae]|uniref:hypothetical protein n=1 Tax=Marinomonas fungiae TaxID=1137284 RepID=UPI003A9107A6
MGIGSNWGVEIAEQEHKEALFEEMINEAAALVAIGGHSRESAYKAAKELIDARQEAISKSEYSEDEGSNTICFFDSSLEGTTIPSGKRAQIKAIAQELRDKYEGDL